MWQALKYTLRVFLWYPCLTGSWSFFLFSDTHIHKPTPFPSTNQTIKIPSGFKMISFMKEIELWLSHHLYLRVETPQHTEMRIYSETPITNSDMEWLMRNNTEEGLESKQNELHTCEIPSLSHLPTGRQRRLNISPCGDNERAVCEGKGDSTW